MSTNPQAPSESSKSNDSILPLNNREALNYLDSIWERFSTTPEIPFEFQRIMKDYNRSIIDGLACIRQAAALFHGHPDLVQGLNVLLLPGHTVEVIYAAQTYVVKVFGPTWESYI